MSKNLAFVSISTRWMTFPYRYLRKILRLAQIPFWPSVKMSHHQCQKLWEASGLCNFCSGIPSTKSVFTNRLILIAWRLINQRLSVFGVTNSRKHWPITTLCSKTATTWMKLGSEFKQAEKSASSLGMRGSHVLPWAWQTASLSRWMSALVPLKTFTPEGSFNRESHS